MKSWVLITRPGDEAEQLGEALAAQNMELFGYPVLREVAADDEDGWRWVRAHHDRLAALLFTSPRAPRRFRQVGEHLELWAQLAALPADAVGEATAVACRRAGLQVRLVGTAGGAALAAETARHLRLRDVVLHPCGRHHRDEAAATLAAARAEIVPLVVYDMEENAPAALPPLPAAPPAAVLLTSPRAVAAYRRSAPAHVLAAPHFALGPTTGAAAARLGVSSRILPKPNPLLLVEELCRI